MRHTAAFSCDSMRVAVTPRWGCLIDINLPRISRGFLFFENQFYYVIKFSNLMIIFNIFYKFFFIERYKYK